MSNILIDMIIVYICCNCTNIESYKVNHSQYMSYVLSKFQIRIHPLKMNSSPLLKHDLSNELISLITIDTSLMNC